jgi:hypothetical protein
VIADDGESIQVAGQSEDRGAVRPAVDEIPAEREVVPAAIEAGGAEQVAPHRYRVT